MAGLLARRVDVGSCKSNSWLVVSMHLTNKLVSTCFCQSVRSMENQLEKPTRRHQKGIHTIPLSYFVLFATIIPVQVVACKQLPIKTGQFHKRSNLGVYLASVKARNSNPPPRKRSSTPSPMPPCRRFESPTSPATASQATGTAAATTAVAHSAHCGTSDGWTDDAGTRVPPSCAALVSPPNMTCQHFMCHR